VVFSVSYETNSEVRQAPQPAQSIVSVMAILFETENNVRTFVSTSRNMPIGLWVAISSGDGAGFVAGAFRDYTSRPQILLLYCISVKFTARGRISLRINDMSAAATEKGHSEGH
jgi:hypothetical protein